MSCTALSGTVPWATIVVYGNGVFYLGGDFIFNYKAFSVLN